MGSTVVWTVVFAFPACFVLAFANGGNDCANSVGTSVGSKSMSVRQALISDSCVEALGALTIGPFVAGTIAGGEIYAAKFVDIPETFGLAMLSVAIAAGSTTLLATLYGYPISATHGVVSGIVAVALASGIPGAVNWSGVGFTLVGWITSPLIGGLGGFCVSLIVHKCVIGAADPVRAARASQPVLLAGTLYISSLFFFVKGPRQISEWIDRRYWIAALLAFFVSGVASLLFCKFRKEDSYLPGVVEEVSSPVENPLSRASPSLSAEEVTPDEERSVNEHRHDRSTTSSSPGSSSAEDGAVQRPFAPLLVTAGLTVAFAHGGNDIGNAAAPLAVIIDVAKTGSVSEEPPGLPFAFLALVIVAFVGGIAALGARTIATVGSKITDLIPSRSFSTQLGAAMAVLASSMCELPVSTSHCLVGSMVGVAFAEKACGVRGAELDLSVLGKIVLGWAVTIPLAAGISVAAFLLFTSLAGNR